MNKIKKTTPITEILDQLPEAAEILLDLGVGCVRCAMSAFETLEEGLIGHGFSDEEIQEVVNDLNELATTKEN